MKGILHILYFLCLAWILAACSTTKYVGDGEYLLDKVEIVSDNKSYKANELKPYLRQQPNFKVFGLMKWQLFVYDWSGRNEKRWLSKQLRRIGDPACYSRYCSGGSVDRRIEAFLYQQGDM